MNFKIAPRTFLYFIFLLFTLESVMIGGLYLIYDIQTAANVSVLKSDEMRVAEIGASRQANEMRILTSDLRYLGASRALSRWLLAGDGAARDDLRQDFLAFATARLTYDQVRLLDLNGAEIVAIDRAGKGFVAVPADKLQDKADRYYTIDTLRLGPGQIYVSPLDLNVEHGAIERPVKPELRVSTPVFDADGHKKGMVILNYGAAQLLAHLRLLAASSKGDPWLLNNKGYWLMGPVADEWAFMDPERKARTLAQIDPGTWQVMTHGQASGQFMANGDLLSYVRMTVPGVAAGRRGKQFLTGWSWIFATHVPAARLSALRWEWSYPFRVIAAVLVPLLGVIALVSAYQYARREQAEKERDDAELHARGEKLANLIIESSPQANLVANGEGCIVRMNAAAEELFGYRRNDLMGQSVETLIPARLRHKHAGLRHTFHSSKTAHMSAEGRELVALCKDGREILVEIGLGQMQVGNDRHAVVSVTDITARKAAEAELKVAMDGLARSNADLEQFAYAAAHDLQEPLRSIGGMLQLLHGRYAERLDDKADTLINHAVTGAQRMQGLIDDLLTYSHAGREAEVSTVDCNAVMDEVTQALGQRLGETGANVSWADLPTIVANRTMILQLFQNLVANAIKFRGGKDPEVNVSAEMDGDGNWTFAVADNGIGIDPKFRTDIFKVFRRLHSHQAYEGSGIGLALCRRIVEHHEGRIWVDSEPGQGATFKFELASNRQPGGKEVQGR